MAREKTRKWIASNYTCYGTGYCDLQYLLRFQSRDYYTTGIYGWNFDIYTFGDYAITTGYRGMIHHVDRNFNLEREYDLRAYSILNDARLSYEEQKKQVNELLEDFLRKIFEDDSIKV